MQKEAKVIALLPDYYAEVSVKRDSACGDCSNCGGCNGGCIRIKVKNTLAASVGDTVLIETASSFVIALAAIVYILPILLFFVGYILGNLLKAQSIILGIFSFFASAGIIILLNKKISGKIAYHMVKLIKES